MKATSILVVVCFTLLCSNVRADNKVVPVMEGEKAPFSGLLVPEDRFIQLMGMEIELVALKAKYEAQIRFSVNLEEMYKKQLEFALRPIPWYQTPSVNRWLGWILGVAMTLAAVYGGTEVVKATKGK